MVTWINMKYGHYDLFTRLGTGGMAEVFLARKAGPAGFEKVIALKRILPHLRLSPEFMQMFLDEARIAALMDHPHIAHVYDFGKEDGLYYLAMEYVSGETLLELIRRAALHDRPVPFEGAATILIAACEALHAAHEVRARDGRPLGIVHRDVTPSNIMIRYDGTLKLVDFGVAKAELHPGRERRGARKGKFAYMSPRQAVGKEVDRRADIWSLGVCAWELCTGRRLFYRDTETKILRAVMEEAIPRPDRLRPDLPKGFADILMMALDRNREKRWDSCQEMQLAVEEYLATSGVLPSKIMLSQYLREVFGEHHIRRRERLPTLTFNSDRERTRPTVIFPGHA